MPIKGRIPSCSLRIYLIKEDRNDPTSILIKNKYKHKISIKYGDTEIGKLYIKPPVPKLPLWANVFRGYIEDESMIGQVASSAAVFLIHERKRWFAIAFGQGRYLLEPECWEEHFGLRVVLNTIGENQLKSIDKVTFDKIPKHSRDQASREGTVQDFGFDVEQDLLRAVTGTPSDTNLGLRLSGMDALKAQVRIRLEDIPKLLSLYYDKYLESSYKSKFPWIDHLSEIRDSRLHEKLDSLLIDMINNGNFDRCWLAAPNILEWDRVNGFRYNLSMRSPLYHDIHFPEFIESLPCATIDKEKLTKNYVRCIGDDDNIIDKWSVYKCIYCELDYSGNSYLLSNGKWYRVTKDFVKKIDDAFRQIERYELKLPKYDYNSETEYNKNVSENNPDVFALMDRKIIIHNGNYNKIEFCDLYTNSKDIIHVKRYGGSSVLSHLFAQGVISGELFRIDKEFRKKVNTFLPESHKIEDLTSDLNHGTYRIVFAIISDSEKDDLNLPFFSRLNVRQAARRLKAYGYKVALAKIDVTENKRKLKRYGSIDVKRKRKKQ